MKKILTQKKFIIIFLLLLSFIILFIGFNNQLFMKYNMNPDNSKKTVISKSLGMEGFSIRAKNLDEITVFADLIITGKVVGKTVDVENYLPDDATQKIYGGMLDYPLSTAKIKVTKVLYGNVDTKHIILLQKGNPNNNSGETKVKKEDNMLFILRFSEVYNNLYYTVRDEDGLFIINKFNKLMSLSDNITVAKYDGTKLKLLETDLKQSIERTKKEDLRNK